MGIYHYEYVVFSRMPGTARQQAVDVACNFMTTTYNEHYHKAFYLDCLRMKGVNRLPQQQHYPFFKLNGFIFQLVPAGPDKCIGSLRSRSVPTFSWLFRGKNNLSTPVINSKFILQQVAKNQRPEYIIFAVVAGGKCIGYIEP